MEDFRISTTWRNHRKRKRLRKLLGADGVLALEDLWSFAAELHTDGVLENMNASDMADEVDYPGDAEAMLKVFIDLRLMDSPDSECSHFRFHDWAVHQRWIVGHKERSERARQAALQKHHGNQRSALPAACDEHAVGMPAAYGGDTPSPSPDPFPDPSPDPSPSPSPDPKPKKKRVKKPHPGEAHKKDLQSLSDHHADLFERNRVPVILDDNVKRIVKVLESLGRDACFLIQEGHKLLENNERFMGWHNAYPPIRLDGKAKRIEPNMEWIERHRAAGERSRKGGGGRDWEKEPFA